MNAFRPFFAVIMLVCLIVSVSDSAQAAWWWPFGKDEIEYTIDLRGVPDDIMPWLEELELDQPTPAHPLESVDELRQEAVSHAQRLRRAFAAKGYYDTVVRQQVFKNDEPPRLRFNIRAGRPYEIKMLRVEWADKPLKTLDVSTLQTKPGQRPDAATIQEDAATVLDMVSKDHCFLSVNVTPVVQLYPQRTADVVFRVTHGPQADFGATIIEGNTSVKDTLILRAVIWKQGDCFNAQKMALTQTSLVQNPLLSTARVTTAQTPNADGQVPVMIEVSERVPRTVTIGANFSTDRGAGVTLGWEHRNFFGNTEKFNTQLTLAQQEQSILNNLRIPHFYRDNQTLALAAGIKRENTDVYTANTLNVGATLERRLSDRWNGGLGVGYTMSQTEDALTGSNQYALISFPGFLEYDGRDDILDTQKGLYGRVSFTPYTETFGDGGQFFKTQGTLQHYTTFESFKWRPTIALRATGGTIAGADGNSVPSDIRFYAGGGGSMRGYGFQSLGPRVGNDPVGGNSMVAGSTELRFRFTETIGGVTFLDAGNAYEESYPDIGEKIYFGAGVGARYYSAVGPVRFDVGVPLNGQDIGETGFQIYVSLGQAF